MTRANLNVKDANKRRRKQNKTLKQSRTRSRNSSTSDETSTMKRLLQNDATRPVQQACQILGFHAREGLIASECLQQGNY
jgi:hypothetical protein